MKSRDQYSYEYKHPQQMASKWTPAIKKKKKKGMDNK